MIDHGPWKIKSSRQIYRDGFVEVRGDDVIRPDGHDGHHVVVAMKAGVCVVAMDSEKNVYLTDEFHYGIGRNSLEGVSGGMEPGDGALETAQRELKEEIGINASNWRSMGCVDPFTTIVVSPTRLFLATELVFGESNQEGTEQIRMVKLSLDDTITKVMDGTISHGPTCVLLLKILAEKSLADS